MDLTAELLIPAIANYSAFNASRSLGVAAESEFSVRTYGKAVALHDSARAKSPFFNRVLGLGVDDAGKIDAILAHYESLGCAPHFDLSADGLVPEVVLALTERGFEPDDALHYLSRKPKRRVSADVSVERWGAGRADDFRALLSTSGVTCEDSIWGHAALALLHRSVSGLCGNHRWRAAGVGYVFRR